MGKITVEVKINTFGTMTHPSLTYACTIVCNCNVQLNLFDTL